MLPRSLACLCPWRPWLQKVIRYSFTNERAGRVRVSTVGTWLLLLLQGENSVGERHARTTQHDSLHGRQAAADPCNEEGEEAEKNAFHDFLLS